jgi:hypothetical protein
MSRAARGCVNTVIAYNSCRNRHCPKCQGVAAKQWLAEREAELPPVGFHLVFTLPAPIADIAYHNKTAIYGLLFKGLHRIRHYKLFANGNRAANIARARDLLALPSCSKQPEMSNTAAADEPGVLPRPCRCCGGRMIIIETFAPGCPPKHRTAPPTMTGDVDTS